jgi:hypothetical protein
MNKLLYEDDFDGNDSLVYDPESDSENAAGIEITQSDDETHYEEAIQNEQLCDALDPTEENDCFDSKNGRDQKSPVIEGSDSKEEHQSRYKLRATVSRTIRKIDREESEVAARVNVDKSKKERSELSTNKKKSNQKSKRTRREKKAV